MAKVVILILVITGVMALAASSILEEQRPRSYMCNDIKVMEAGIREKVQDGNKFWMKIYAGVNYPNWDDLWIEVSPDFYNRHNQNTRIGALVGEYDIYKTGKEFFFFGPAVRKYLKNAATVENVYDTFDDARQANPTRQYAIESTVKARKAGRDGTFFLIIDAQGKKVKVAVGSEDYNRYREGRTLNCTFESTGDFVRFQGLVTAGSNNTPERD